MVRPSPATPLHTHCTVSAYVGMGTTISLYFVDRSCLHVECILLSFARHVTALPGHYVHENSRVLVLSTCDRLELAVLLRHHSEEDGQTEQKPKLNKKGKHSCRVGVIGWTSPMNKQKLD